VRNAIWQKGEGLATGRKGQNNTIATNPSSNWIWTFSDL